MKRFEKKGQVTYSAVELGTGALAERLCFLLGLRGAAGELALDLCRGLVNVGWETFC